jgi:hypothetical protein
MKSKISVLLLTCGAVALSPISAQESARPEVTIKPAQPLKPADANGEPRREKERDEKRKPEQDGRGKPEKDKHQKPDHEGRSAPKEKLTTYLGLLLRGVAPELAAQVGIPEGFGLLVADVAKDSPAAEAKFETHDVIVMIGDQRVVNLPQFQALIRSQKKGDEVTLTIHRKGEEQKVSAKLGERMLPVESPHGMHHPMMQSGPGMHPMHQHMMNRHGMEPRDHNPEMKSRGHSGPDTPHTPRDNGPDAKGPDGPPRGAPNHPHDERKEGSRDGDRRPNDGEPPRPSKTRA